MNQHNITNESLALEKYIFALNNRWLTILMVLFICVNAAFNAKKRSRSIDHGFVSRLLRLRRAPLSRWLFCCSAARWSLCRCS